MMPWWATTAFIGCGVIFLLSFLALEYMARQERKLREWEETLRKLEGR